MVSNWLGIDSSTLDYYWKVPNKYDSTTKNIPQNAYQLGAGQHRWTDHEKVEEDNTTLSGELKADLEKVEKDQSSKSPSCTLLTGKLTFPHSIWCRAASCSRSSSKAPQMLLSVKVEHVLKIRLKLKQWLPLNAKIKQFVTNRKDHCWNASFDSHSTHHHHHHHQSQVQFFIQCYFALLCICNEWQGSEIIHPVWLLLLPEWLKHPFSVRCEATTLPFIDQMNNSCCPSFWAMPVAMIQHCRCLKVSLHRRSWTYLWTFR